MVSLCVCSSHPVPWVLVGLRIVDYPCGFEDYRFGLGMEHILETISVEQVRYQSYLAYFLYITRQLEQGKTAIFFTMLLKKQDLV